MAESGGLSIEHVSRAFGGVLALDDLSVRIPDDAITAIIGPNGAGKTTLFNVITGYVAPQTGSLSFGGRRLNRLGPHRRARLGIVRTFQELRLFESLSVIDNLRLAGLGSPLPVMEELGLVEYATERTGALSYAIQKLVALGRALVMRPKLLLLDEPTSGLDGSSVNLMLDALARLRERAMGVCIIEHNLEVVRQLDPHVLCLHMGSLFAEGDLRTLSANAEVQQIFFGEETGDGDRATADQR